MDLLTRRYVILASLLAALGAVTAVVTVLVFFITPNPSAKDITLAIMLGGSGAAVFFYYISIHQLLKKNHMVLSTAIMAVLAAALEVILISATGGIDSPYYSLWILAIVIAGFFGQKSTIVVSLSTLAYFGYDFWSHGFDSAYVATHVGILFMTIGTAAIAEWIHIFLGRGMVREGEVQKLSGALSAESLKTDAIMQNVAEGVAVVDLKRQIQLFNPAATRITGWDSGSAKGIDYRLVLNLRDAAGEKLTDQNDPMSKLWKDGKGSVISDLTIETKGGHKLAASLSLSPVLDSQKKITGGIILFRDISAEKEVERQRNEFISTASHEMRTPVAAIEGYLSLAMNPSVATIDDRAKGYLDKAHNATKHLGELFRDLLSITKMEENGKAPTVVFDLAAVVKEAVADMKLEADKKKLGLQLNTSDVKVRGENSIVPVYAVNGNPERIREVVMNLIENALKFTSEGTIRVTIGGTSETVTVSVIDTGVGISAEDAAHLFQKFYRVDSTATRTIGGTGLGLYLCRSIIEQASGRIWVDSKLGEGSAFRFTLPRLASNMIGKQAPGANQAGTKTTATPVDTKTLGAPVPIPQPAAMQASVPAMASGPAVTDIKKPALVR